LAKRRARQLGTSLFRYAASQRAALWLARVRNRALVLVYHRVAPDGPAAHEVVRSTPSAVFADHLQILQQIGEIVPLSQLLEQRGRGHGPRFAITFDDDHPSHVRWTMPMARALRVHITFFLSGRTLRHMGHYWWSVLEQSIEARGLEYTRQTLGLQGSTPGQLADAVRESRLSERLSDLLPPVANEPMAADDMRALAAEGMAIGFHTLRHPVMTELASSTLRLALVDGRDALAAACGAPVDLFAYPHGLANAEVAQAAEQAKFRAAFTTRERAVAANSDRYLLGRWDPGMLSGDAFVAAVALRLSLPATTAQRRHRPRVTAPLP
jgi:peptidoglycan/xylan/chitin deacetylase (PgdA/CDA1 family)